MGHTRNEDTRKHLGAQVLVK